MRDTYFSVKECRPEELEELQFRLYSDNDLIEDLSDDEKEIVCNAELPSDIPLYIVEKVFDYVVFVDEDFGCNIE